VSESETYDRLALDRAKRKAERTRHEDELFTQVVAAGLPKPMREHKFLDDRRFRWDLAWPGYLVAVEVNGGTWMPPDKDGNRRGAHGGGLAAERDAEKLSLAAVAGWRVLSVVPSQIRSGAALGWIQDALTGTIRRSEAAQDQPARAVEGEAPAGERPWRRGVLG